METRVLDKIEFGLDQDTISKRAGVKTDEDSEEFRILLDKARTVAKPKAVYRECFIERKGDDTVTINDITFTSRVMRHKLDGVERVFAYVATCGHELDEISLQPGDFLMPFWLDAIKQNLLSSAYEGLKKHLDRRFALGKTSTMSPGAGDATVWPIEQQKPLFSLLGDVETLVGVKLTDSFLMVPNKTVSGIRFATEVDFRACQLCRRENCPSRSAEFDHQIWEEVGTGKF
jgi:hypothetical protein